MTEEYIYSLDKMAEEDVTEECSLDKVDVSEPKGEKRTKQYHPYRPDEVDAAALTTESETDECNPGGPKSETNECHSGVPDAPTSPEHVGASESFERVSNDESENIIAALANHSTCGSLRSRRP